MGSPPCMQLLHRVMQVARQPDNLPKLLQCTCLDTQVHLCQQHASEHHQTMLVLKSMSAAGHCLIESPAPGTSLSAFWGSCQQACQFHLTQLLMAADAICWLCQHGADCKRVKADSWKDTALHYAAASGRLPAVQALLAAGCDPAAKNYAGAPLLSMLPACTLKKGPLQALKLSSYVLLYIPVSGDAVTSRKPPSLGLVPVCSW